MIQFNKSILVRITLGLISAALVGCITTPNVINAQHNPADSAAPEGTYPQAKPTLMTEATKAPSPKEKPTTREISSMPGMNTNSAPSP